MQAHSILIILALLLTAKLYAAEVDNDEDWHQIEVIIFTQQDLNGTELNNPQPMLSYPGNIRHLNTDVPLSDSVTVDASYNEKLAALMIPTRFLSHQQAARPISYAALEKSARQLNPDAYTLRRNSHYSVLFHQAWQQPVNAPEQAQWLIIKGGGQYGDHFELEGSLRVYHSRFYHVESHLWLNHFANRSIAEQNLGNERALNPTINLPESPLPAKSLRLLQLDSIDRQNPLPGSSLRNIAEVVATHYRVTDVDVLKSSEQLRRKELHYIDHPRMGVLILITPINLDDDDTSEP